MIYSVILDKQQGATHSRYYIYNILLNFSLTFHLKTIYRKCLSLATLHRYTSQLMYALDCGEYANVISWSDDGKSFNIKDRSALEQVVLPEIFRVAKFSSFLRKLYRWGFVRLRNKGSSGTNDSYINPDFTRGDHASCEMIRCTSSSGASTISTARDSSYASSAEISSSSQHLCNFSAASAVSGASSIEDPTSSQSEHNVQHQQNKKKKKRHTSQRQHRHLLDLQDFQSQSYEDNLQRESHEYGEDNEMQLNAQKDAVQKIYQIPPEISSHGPQNELHQFQLKRQQFHQIQEQLHQINSQLTQNPSQYQQIQQSQDPCRVQLENQLFQKHRLENELFQSLIVEKQFSSQISLHDAAAPIPYATHSSAGNTSSDHNNASANRSADGNMPFPGHKVPLSSSETQCNISFPPNSRSKQINLPSVSSWQQHPKPDNGVNNDTRIGDDPILHDDTHTQTYKQGRVQNFNNLSTQHAAGFRQDPSDNILSLVDITSYEEENMREYT